MLEKITAERIVNPRYIFINVMKKENYLIALGEDYFEKSDGLLYFMYI